MTTETIINVDFGLFTARGSRIMSLRIGKTPCLRARYLLGQALATDPQSVSF